VTSPGAKPSSLVPMQSSQKPAGLKRFTYSSIPHEGAHGESGSREVSTTAPKFRIARDRRANPAIENFNGP
jgi:hypothetical protein